MMRRNTQGKMTANQLPNPIQEQPNEVPTIRERRRLLIIHGVGDFDETTITAEVQGLARKYGIVASDVTAFNWDREIGGPFKGLSMNLAILAELGGGLLNLANLGFLQASQGYCGIPQWYLRLQNCLFVFGQIAFSFLIFLSPYIVLNDSYKAGFLWVIAVLSVSCILGALLSVSIQGLVVNFRRLLVTVLWPVFHFFAVPVGFGLIALVIVILSVRLWNTFEGQIQNAFLAGLFYVAVRVGAVLVAVVIMWRVARFVNPVLKVLSDVARYIGLVELRRKLQSLLARKFQEVAADSNHLIVLAHSLGSVIAVDTMLGHSGILKTFRQLVFVTMGSPLRRLFHGFFPQIYSSTEAIDQNLRKNINGFRWVNIYRPLDFVGAQLSSEHESLIVEYSTHQLLKNHMNYWRDTLVAELIVKGLEEAQRSETCSTTIASSSVANWPTELCTEEYRGLGLAQLWSHRFHIFMGIFLLWVLWQIYLMTALSYKAIRNWQPLEMMQELARERDWASMLGFLLVAGMFIFGWVAITRFAYNRIWREWLGAYGASLLGCIEVANRSPLMRFAPQPDVVYSFEGRKYDGYNFDDSGEALFQQFNAKAANEDWTGLAALAEQQKIERPQWLTPCLAAGEAYFNLDMKDSALANLNYFVKRARNMKTFEQAVNGANRMIEEINGTT